MTDTKNQVSEDNSCPKCGATDVKKHPDGEFQCNECGEIYSTDES